jgi:hypothetical protein
MRLTPTDLITAPPTGLSVFPATSRFSCRSQAKQDFSEDVPLRRTDAGGAIGRGALDAGTVLLRARRERPSRERQGTCRAAAPERRSRLARGEEDGPVDTVTILPGHYKAGWRRHCAKAKLKSEILDHGRKSWIPIDLGGDSS